VKDWRNYSFWGEIKSKEAFPSGSPMRLVPATQFYAFIMVMIRFMKGYKTAEEANTQHLRQKTKKAALKAAFS
jgi:hypothetical protein